VLDGKDIAFICAYFVYKGDKMPEVVLDRSSPVPLYFQLLEIMKRDLSLLKNGARFSTERELVELYDISRVTVAKAVNQLVNEGVLVRVQGKGTYVREKADKTAISNILFFTPSPLHEYISGGNPLVGDLVRGVMEEAEKIGANMLFVSIPQGVTETEYCTAKIIDMQADGVIFLALQNLAKLIVTAKRRSIPSVLLNVKTAGLEQEQQIFTLETVGIKKVVDYLVSLGHSRIGYVGPGVATGSLPQVDRLAGYHKALSDNGLQVEGGAVLDWNVNHPKIKLLEFLRKNDKTTAIVAQNDEIACEVIRMLQGIGKNVPRQISVTGFDNAPYAEKFDPGLTTVAMPRAEMGRVAVRKLLAIINGKNPGLAGNQLEPELIIRHSAARLAAF
jgi:GntR family transcriptional regulator of arabinose operon